uniref:Uncharacterized protein n=1 Tax=Rhipicephalus zambeziensis TaxID=60191 RepID=A0A224Z1Q2_9ACAR
MGDRRRDSRGRPPPFEPRPQRHPPPDMPPFHKPMNSRPSLIEPSPHHSRGMPDRQRRRDPGDEGPMEHRRRHPDYDDRYPVSASVPPMHFDGPLRDDGGRDGRGHRGRRLPEEHDELSLETYDYRGPGGGDPRDPRGPPRRPSEPPRRPQSTPRYGGDRERFFESPDRGRRPFGYPERLGGERDCFDGFRDRGELDREYYRGRDDPQNFGDEMNHEHRPDRMQRWPDDDHEWRPPPPGPRYGDERGRPGGMGQRPFVPEYSGGFDEGRPSSMPGQESRRSSSVPSGHQDWGPEGFREGPHNLGPPEWEDEFGSLPYHPEPPDFRGVERGPFPSAEYPGGNMRDPDLGGYEERPPKSSSRDRGYPSSREFDECGREMSGIPPYEDRPPHSPGSGRRHFREGFSDGQGPPRFSSYQQPLSGPMGQEERRPFQGVGPRDIGSNLDNLAFDKRPMMPLEDEAHPPLRYHPKGMAMEHAAESGNRKIHANPENPWPNFRTTGCSDQPGASRYQGPPLSQERSPGVPAKGMGGIPVGTAPLAPPPQPPFPAMPGRPSSSVDISQQCHRTPVAASRCEGPPGSRGPPQQRPLIGDKCRTESAAPLPGPTGEMRPRSAGPQAGNGVSQKPEIAQMQPSASDQYQRRTPVASCVTSTPQPPQSKDTPPVTASQQRQTPPAAPCTGSVSQAPKCGYLPPATADQQQQRQAAATCASDVSQGLQSTNHPPVKDQQRQRPPLAPCASGVSQTTQSAQLPAAKDDPQWQRPTVTAAATSVSETPQNAPHTPAKAEQQRQRPPVTTSVSSVSQIAPESAMQNSPSEHESKDDPPASSTASHSPVEERPSGIEDRKGQRPISFPLPKGKLEKLASQVLRTNPLEKAPRPPTIGSIQSHVSAQSSNDKQFSGSSDKQQRPIPSQGSSGPTQCKGPTPPLASQQLTASTVPAASAQKPIPAPPLPPSQLTSQTFLTTTQLTQASTGNPTLGCFSAPGATEVRPPITTAYPQQFFPMTYMPIPFAQEGYMAPSQQLSGPSPPGSYDFQQGQATTLDTKNHSSLPSSFLRTAAGQRPASLPAQVSSTPTPSYFTTPQRPIATDVQEPTASPLPPRGQGHPTSASKEQLRLPSANQQKMGEKGTPPQREEQGDAKGGQTPVCDPKQDRPGGSDVSSTIDAASKSLSKLSTSNIEKCISDVEMIDADEDNSGTRGKGDAKVDSGGTAPPAKTLTVDQGMAKDDVPQKAPLGTQAIQSKNQNADTEKRRTESPSKADASTTGETKVLEDEAYPKKPVCFMMREFALKRQEASMKEQETELKDAEKLSQRQEPSAKEEKAKEPKAEGSLTADKDMLYGPRPPTVEEIREKSKNTSAPDKTSNIKSSAGSRAALYDQEVSSSTPETAVAGSSKQGNDREIDPSGVPRASAEKKVEIESTRQEDTKPTEKIEQATSRKNDDSSDERSGHSSERSSRATDDSYRRRSSKRRRTYSSSDDKYEDESDVENTNDGVCLSGRGNEGQVFGIPVVFKAISTTRTFWNIRGGQVARELEEVVGDNVVNQKINRAGFLCVNVATAADAVKLLNLKRLGGAEVESVIPSMYLRHEAKIRGVPYHYTNEKLAELFADVGVLSARRQLTVKRLHDGSYEEFPRSSVVLTFKPDATLPRTLELDNEKFIVEEYIEAPLQCFKCLRFGHTSRACVSVSRCKNCGARYCDEECERRTPMCANCFGPHQATYVGCPRRREVAFASLWKRTFDLNAL